MKFLIVPASIAFAVTFMVMAGNLQRPGNRQRQPSRHRREQQTTRTQVAEGLKFIQEAQQRKLDAEKPREEVPVITLPGCLRCHRPVENEEDYCHYCRSTLRPVRA